MPCDTGPAAASSGKPDVSLAWKPGDGARSKAGGMLGQSLVKSGQADDDEGLQETQHEWLPLLEVDTSSRSAVEKSLVLPRGTLVGKKSCQKFLVRHCRSSTQMR